MRATILGAFSSAMLTASSSPSSRPTSSCGVGKGRTPGGAGSGARVGIGMAGAAGGGAAGVVSVIGVDGSGAGTGVWASTGPADATSAGTSTRIGINRHHIMPDLPALAWSYRVGPRVGVARRRRKSGGRATRESHEYGWPAGGGDREAASTSQFRPIVRTFGP